MCPATTATTTATHPMPAANRRAGRVVQLATALVTTFTLGACAGLRPAQPQPGQAEAELPALLGQPTGSYALPGGAKRLEYATGPYGRTTLMVDVAADGRVSSSQQVLTEANFAKVRNGMSRDALLLLLGRPADKAGEYMNRQTWSWRYPTHDCLWARVTLNAEGRVWGGASYLPDPRCDADD